MCSALVGHIFVFDRKHTGLSCTTSQLRHAGIALMATGGVMGIAGAVIGFRAKKEDKKRYGWRLVSPGYNELGVAYNF